MVGVGVYVVDVQHLYVGSWLFVNLKNTVTVLTPVTSVNNFVKPS